MLQYVVAGLALGSIYAIASSALVLTFVSSGVLNFAFAAIAYFVARTYYWLNSVHGMPSYEAATICLLVVAPLLGVLLYASLFRFIRDKSTLIKLVVTIGLSVSLPAITDLIFGSETIAQAPGLAAPTDRPIHFLGTPITTDQLTMFGFLIFILVVGTGVLRFSRIGLRIRAMVDSEAMATLSGTHSGRVSVGVWAATASLTGLAGILIAPSQGLNVAGMSALMAAGFAAVVAARLRSLPVAVAVSLAMGVVTDVIQRYLPPNSSITSAIVTSIPFAVILLFLLFYVVRGGSIREEKSGGGPLDEAIRPASEDPTVIAEIATSTCGLGNLLGTIPILVIAVLPLIFGYGLNSVYWLGLTGEGICYGIMMLTFTVVIGEGGMLWLSQAIFAGSGALLTAHFVASSHIPVLVATLIAALIVGAVGAVIGFLTIRLGDLYVGLVTFSFSLLVETLVFTRPVFYQGGIGIPISPPSFAQGPMVFCYFALAVFAVFAVLTWNLRRSTSGLALRAVRDSEAASRTLGLSILQVKVIVGALAAFVAAVGGSFIAMSLGVAQQQDFETYLGLVWLAIAVTLGVRSITAAAFAGLSTALIPAVFLNYLPPRWTTVPTVFFGLGAIGAARQPEGVVLHTARQIRSLLGRSPVHRPLRSSTERPSAEVSEDRQEGFDLTVGATAELAGRSLEDPR